MSRKCMVIYIRTSVSSNPVQAIFTLIGSFRKMSSFLSIKEPNLHAGLGMISQTSKDILILRSTISLSTHDCKWNVILASRLTRGHDYCPANDR